MKFLNQILLILFLYGCQYYDSNSSKVIITSPEDNSIISVLVTINCVVAEDIDKVELWVDGISTGIEDDLKPYSIIWKKISKKTNNYRKHIWNSLIKT